MQMNDFFSRKKLITVGFFFTIAIFAILFTFGKLAFSPIPSVQKKLPQVERGDITDRNGKPLAVQTNFYHFVITPKDVQVVDFLELLEDFSARIQDKLDLAILKKQIYVAKLLNFLNFLNVFTLVEVIADTFRSDKPLRKSWISFEYSSLIASSLLR